MTGSTTARATRLRPLRVLMILTYYHPHWTGLTAYAKRLAEGLVRRGHGVTVITSRHDPALARDELLHGVRVVRLPVAARMSRGALMPGLPGAVRRHLREADVVQMHTPLLEAPVITFLARRAGVPSVFTHHGDLVMPAGLFNAVVGRTVTALMARAADAASCVTVHSADYAAHSRFLARAAAKLHAIHPPVDLPAPDAEGAARWRAALGLAGRPVAAFAGRWVEEKGFDYLLRAIPAVVRAVPDVHLVYAGEAPAYETFFARCRPLFEPVRDRVTLLGLLTEPQRLADFYALADVFVLPSRTDCFPSAQVEAVRCGTPVVATDIPGARDVVRLTGMGRLVPPHDPAALAAGIVDVIRNPARYRDAGDRARTLCDPDRSAAEYEALFQTLV